MIERSQPARSGFRLLDHSPVQQLGISECQEPIFKVAGPGNPKATVVEKGRAGV